MEDNAEALGYAIPLERHSYRDKNKDVEKEIQSDKDKRDVCLMRRMLSMPCKDCKYYHTKYCKEN